MIEFNKVVGNVYVYYFVFYLEFLIYFLFVWNCNFLGIFDNWKNNGFIGKVWKKCNSGNIFSFYVSCFIVVFC